MRSLVSLRATTLVTARSVVGLGLLVAFSSGCSVDDSGLAATSTKLQRDAGGTGGSISPTGIGGDTAGGGVSGAAGAIGAGGDIASGGVNGSAGAGAGGSIAAGGVTGSGGATATGGSGAGGATATGGTPGSGGATPAGGATGSGGATAMGGAGGVPATGTGGTGATGGAIGSGGATGTGGMLATGGTTGTGVVATGGANGTGGATGTGGAGGTPCGPTNCMGCCASDGQCVQHVTASQCGIKGAACVACGPCQICGATASGSNGGGTAGTCAIDPSSQWTIIADTAQLSMTPPGGGTWDPKTGDEGGSAPDPFCEYENPSGDVSATTAGVTDTVTDAFSVTWDEEITPPNVTVSAAALMATKPAWRIWVGDEDCSNPRNCGTLGQIACSYQQPITAASLMSGGLTISNYQNCVSLTLSFVCQAPAAATP
jgi:hypothetical protein